MIGVTAYDVGALAGCEKRMAPQGTLDCCTAGESHCKWAHHKSSAWRVVRRNMVISNGARREFELKGPSGWRVLRNDESDFCWKCAESCHNHRQPAKR